jgi:hypothetical protein
MGQQWKTNGINMGILFGSREHGNNGKTMGKQWARYDSYMDTFLRSDNYKNNGGKMGKQWGNNGTEQNSDMDIFVLKTRAE